MTQVRVAKLEDKKDFYRLWKVCFGDSNAFCDWFFENRFSPEHSVVLENDGEIVSCMQAFPYSILIRGKEVPGAMLCGVSTHPEHRQKGYMGKIFSYEINHLRKMGYMVAPHTPAVLPSYFSFGHLPVADASYLKSNVIPLLRTDVKYSILNKDEWRKLYPLYIRFAEKYSGIIKRTEADFLRKADDYAADGGKAIAYMEDDEIRGYAFYYKTEDKLSCVEAVAEDDCWEKLFAVLFAQASGLKFSAKLPPEIEYSCHFAATERLQKGVMGLCNASGLLKALDLDIPYCFRLKDPVVPENNGVFDFKGNLCKEDPVFEISSGHLMQILIGYHSLEELKKEIIFYNTEKFEEINRILPKQNCYIIDEY